MLSDPDFTDIATVTLTVSAGRMLATSADSVTVAGSGSGVLTLTGTVAAINLWLDNELAVLYTSAPDAFGTGAASLTITGDDGFGAVPLATIPIDILEMTDIRSGTPGSDTLRGDAGRDILLGLAGIDVLLGGAGADAMDGGVGIDRVQYTDSAIGLRVDLQAPATNTGIASGDTFISIENLYGSLHNDTLFGDGGGNVINGLDGDDAIDGASGNDTIIGGIGADTFVFATALGAGNIDTISDFNVADDRFLLSDSIFTALTPSLLTAAEFRINSTGLAQDANEHIIYNTSTGALLYDADGTGASAAIQFASLTAGLALTSADFSLA